MNSADRKMLIQGLAQDYLSERDKNRIWQRESSTGYSFATGKLVGACTAFNLDFEESENGVTVFTQGRKKIVCSVKR